MEERSQKIVTGQGRDRPNRRRRKGGRENREWWLVTGMTDERPSDGLRNGLGRRSGDISYLQGKDERETLVNSLLR